MKGWIIYNGNLKTQKIINLIKRMIDISKEMKMNLIAVKNTELLNIYLQNSNNSIIHIENLQLPDYVIFWDKDIKLAKNFEILGIPVFNSSNSIDICDDKALTFEKLVKSDIKIPKTIFSPFTYYEQNLNNTYIEKIIYELNFPLIIKEYKGSFGAQVYKIDNKNQLLKKIKELKNKGFLFQEFIKSSIGQDLRVVCVGEEIIGVMKRSNKNDFRANITIGATANLYKINEEIKSISKKVIKTLNLDFCGIDLLFGDENQLILCEVNSNMNFLSFENLSKINVAKKILLYIKNKLNSN